MHVNRTLRQISTNFDNFYFMVASFEIGNSQQFFHEQVNTSDAGTAGIFASNRPTQLDLRTF